MPDPDLRELTDADRIVTQFVMESKMDTSADQLTFDPQPTTNPSEKSSLQTHRRSRKRLQKEVDELRSRLAQAEQEKESLRARLVSSLDSFEHSTNSGKARAVSSVAIPQPLPVTPSDSAPLSLPAAIEKMTSTVRLLNKTLTLSGRKKLPNGLPASPRAPSWCSRCIVKGGWWVSVHYGKDQEHNCVFDGHATRCRYCTTYGKDKCIPVRICCWSACVANISDSSSALAESSSVDRVDSKGSWQRGCPPGNRSGRKEVRTASS